MVNQVALPFNDASPVKNAKNLKTQTLLSKNVQVEKVEEEEIDWLAPPPPEYDQHALVRPLLDLIEKLKNETLPREGIHVCKMVPIARTVSVYGDKDPLLISKQHSKYMFLANQTCAFLEYNYPSLLGNFANYATILSFRNVRFAAKRA